MSDLKDGSNTKAKVLAIMTGTPLKHTGATDINLLKKSQKALSQNLNDNYQSAHDAKKTIVTSALIGQNVDRLDRATLEAIGKRLRDEIQNLEEKNKKLKAGRSPEAPSETKRNQFGNGK